MLLLTCQSWIRFVRNSYFPLNVWDKCFKICIHLFEHSALRRSRFWRLSSKAELIAEHFKKCLADHEACGYVKDTTDEVNIRLTFFFGDALAVTLSLYSILSRTQPWEDLFPSGLSEEETSSLSLKGVVINRQRPRRVHNFFVTLQRDLAATKNDVVSPLKSF